MDHLNRLSELCEHGQMTWVGREQGWVAQPDEVVSALTNEGYEEYKNEVARTRRDRTPTGGVWQGLNRRTGSVASAVWVNRPATPGALVFIDIDGERFVA